MNHLNETKLVIQKAEIEEIARNTKRTLYSPRLNGEARTRNPLTNDGIPDEKVSIRGSGKYKPPADPAVTGKKVLIDLEHVSDTSWKDEVLSRPKVSYDINNYDNNDNDDDYNTHKFIYHYHYHIRRGIQ